METIIQGLGFRFMILGSHVNPVSLVSSRDTVGLRCLELRKEKSFLVL